MFQRVDDAEFLRGEHACLHFWNEHRVFDRLREKNAGKPRWSFLDGPITANNPMGVHHAWGRTYKDCFQRFFAMKGRDQRFQNGFDCQGLWVEVEVEKELGLGTKNAVLEYGIDRFVDACKQRVLRFAARQTEQSQRLGYWMDWDDPDTLRQLAEAVGRDEPVTITTPSGKTVTDAPHRIVEKLGNPEWGGSYFTFTTENNETIWTFLKKCFERGKIYRGHDVMPWSGRGGSAYSQMEVADGRRLTVHRSVFVRFPIVEKTGGESLERAGENVHVREFGDREEIQLALSKSVQDVVGPSANVEVTFRDESLEPTIVVNGKVVEGEELEQLAKSVGESAGRAAAERIAAKRAEGATLAVESPQPNEFLLVWTTTPWTLTSNVAAAVNPDLDYVRIRSNRDGAIYYFAAENLEFKRMEREFKEGFGRPEWQWPKDVPKLKTIAQIFKEQGGYEVLGTVKGRELVGWKYRGPFDELAAQQQPGGYPGDAASGGRKPSVHAQSTVDAPAQETAPTGSPEPTAIDCHTVIDGGRDPRGTPLVQAGEGTGIVHIAPGCGDVDHVLAQQLGLVGIAPLNEDGRFGDGFGPFTGKEAIDPETATLVFDQLKEKGLLVAVEEYPHVYPHCWRTGDELVFRLVDEWFVNMDWRDEIMDVTRQIRWLPDAIDGQNREVEWLTNMRDWMVSKKRFWGLALPIWINPDDPGDFEVIGSLAELKERAVEGWDDFAGHTPHRPWIDRVKIKSETTGAILERVPDVGNPWLDAGIVPFSTLNYNERFPTDLLNWGDWFPADFVTECFPGQFRNWFYSLLALATMMRHDETDDPAEKRPFKTLLGHRLVMDEHGRPMHKSDGTAIWFEEAAEQLGVDTIRWMYLAQNPAADLRFGLRHPDQPVELNTPEGAIAETKEGLPTCQVTSTPADEIRRQVLIPLWNSYKFFVNYAVLDEFDPQAEPVPVSERPEGDRWILSNLQQFLQTANDRFADYDTPSVCSAAAGFLDDLSNWYIRRNRSRFWRKRVESGESRVESSAIQADASASEPDSQPDRDKLSAYHTLYEVLLTLSKALAPAIPFLAERMYQNLAHGVDLVESGEWRVESSENATATDSQLSTLNSQPSSVHLCDYPEPDASLLDPALNRAVESAQRLVRTAHKLRDEANQRVRQPLAELRFSTSEDTFAADVQRLTGVIADELNVKRFRRVDSLDDLASYSAKPNLKTLGPKYGKQLGTIRKALPHVDAALLAPLREGSTVMLELDGTSIELEPGDVLFETETAPGWHVADDRELRLALDANLTPELVREGMARDFVRHVQQQRKNANLDENAPIRILYGTDSDDVRRAVEEWAETIETETRAVAIEPADDAGDAKPVTVGSERSVVRIEPA